VKIEFGKRVRVKVKLSVDDKVIEESAVEYFQGSGTMLPGLESELEGMEPGSKKSGTIAPKSAFGAKSGNKSIPRTEFPKDAQLDLGMKFQAKSEDGKTDVVLRVSAVDKDAVHCDILHPLAEKSVAFSVEVVSVTDPVPPPLPPGLGGTDPGLKVED
jgi:FKBP-type peptidyl-prolyl cis-trans isomerase 2